MVDPAVNAQQAQSDFSATGINKAKSSKTFDPSERISNMDDLKKVAPQVHKAIMEAVAENIMSQMRKHQERMKKIYREKP